MVKGDTENGKDEQLTAMKVVEEKDVAFREIGILLTLGHPNIVGLLDIIETERSIGIVMPLMNMDLCMFIHCVEYSENEIRGIMTQSMTGVHHMHTRDIVHMDIKPENIGINVMDAVNCVTEKLQCKLLDLGSSIDIGTRATSSRKGLRRGKCSYDLATEKYKPHY
jgi:serine/threonine protein kinase